MGKFSIIAAAVLLSAASALAQTGGVDSKFKRADSNATGSVKLDMVSVTANRSETDVAKYAGQVSVLNQNDLVKSPSVIDAIGSVPGVMLGNDHGRQVGQYYNIRGFGYQSEARVIIEQDGIKRSPSLFSNQISTFRVDNDLLKRVEVVKGASSVLHGSGAVGGIVSMRTKDVSDFINPGSDYGVTIGHRQESNHMNSNRAAIAAKPTENFGILLYGKHADFGKIKMARDGKRSGVKYAENDEQVNTVFAKTEWAITDEHALEASVFNYHEKFSSSPWQSLFWSEDAELPTSGRLKQRDYSVIYKYTPLNNRWINFSAQYYNAKALNHRIRTGFSRGNPVYIDYKNKDDRWGVRLKNESLFETGVLEHRLVTGIDYEHRKEDAIFWHNGALSDFGSFPNFYKDLGIYAQDVFSVGRFEFTLGGRFDKFKRGVKNGDHNSYSESRFSPKLGLAYEVFDGINLLAGYAETFRGPTPNETSSAGPLNPHYWYIPNPDLKPEIAKEYEVGFSVDKQGLLGDDELYFKATYYDGNIKDMINLKARPDKGNPPFDAEAPGRRYGMYENVNNAKRRGVEIESKYAINNLTFSLGYDHTKIYDKATKKILTVYADKLTLGAMYRYEPWGLSLGGDMTHWFRPNNDEKYYVVRGQKYEYVDETFTIVNFKGRWEPKNFDSYLLNKGLKISFGVNNIFNKEYIFANGFKNTTRVGKGRNFYVDFEKTF